jgi:hypothetical protein
MLQYIGNKIENLENIKAICEICQLTGPKNCIWIDCFTCERKIHKKCVPQFKSLSEIKVLIIHICISLKIHIL